jgi:hypothetical protein
MSREDYKKLAQKESIQAKKMDEVLKLMTKILIKKTLKSHIQE